MEQGAVPTQQAKSWFEVPAAQDRALRLPGEALNNRSGDALAQGFRDRAERGPIADRLTDTRSDAEWQPAQSGLISGGGADLLCDGRRGGPAILMRLALISRRVPQLRRSRETHAEEAHSERSAA
jgi:hypothetical protein